MSEFWTWGKYVSWENCIEANRLCNLRTCPETMNCCVTNCIGTPTIKGIILVIGIAVIVTLILFILNIVIKKNESQTIN